MIVRLHTNKDNIDINTEANLSVKDLIDQLEAGNLVLIETIYKSTFIVNMLNVNAIEIFNTEKIDIPPISK